MEIHAAPVPAQSPFIPVDAKIVVGAVAPASPDPIPIVLLPGFEYRMQKYPHRGWAVGGAAGNFNYNRLETGGYDAAGNNLSQTGDPFASFLLGQVHDANQSIYAQPTWHEGYLAPWINAEYKVNSKLKVTGGLRLD